MNKNSPSSIAGKGSIIILLSVFAWLAITSLAEKSATFDEANHLARGLYPLAGKGHLLNREHPPLINLLQALPVHFAERPKIPPATPEMHPFFFHSYQMLWSAGNDGKKMIQQARWVTVGLALILGFLVYLWARELHGRAGGLVALCLFAFSPMILAHGRLVTTDMGLALFLFAFFFALWSLIIHPSPRRLLVTGLCLGAALGSKHIALLLLPASLLILLLSAMAEKAANTVTPPLSKRLLSPVLAWLAMLAMAFFVVWGLYGFEVGKVDGEGMLVPAPDYFGGLLQGWQSLKSGRMYYLNSVVSDTGWISYFPLAFLYKTPLAFLGLLAMTLLLQLSGKIRVGKKMGFIALALGLLLLAVILKKVNLGLRYLLWVYPFLFVYMGAMARVPKWRLALIPMLAWMIFETLGAHPDYLSYFNRAVPQQEKRFHLADSNLDWGQDLPALARFQRQRKINVIQFGYFGTANPRAYGIVATPLTSFLQPQWNGPPTLNLEGVIAVSATLLQGLYNRPPDFYAPLRAIIPTAQVGGGSILIFDFRKGIN